MSRTTIDKTGRNIMEPVFSEKISVSMPAKEKYAALLRLVVSSIGIRLDCTLDQIDDMKLALNEAFLLILSGLKKKRENIDFDFAVDNNKVTVSIPLTDIHVERNTMSTFIINGVSDSFEYKDDAGERKMVITKFINRKDS